MAWPNPPSDPEPASLLERFRSPQPRRADLHPLERVLLGITVAHLCLLPWALGTMHLWSQCTSLGLAAAGFAAALLPREYSERLASGPVARVFPGARLLRFPFFWAGLALLGYIVIQGLNPAWEYNSDAGYWWLSPRRPVPWLPSGVDAPFPQSGPWRALLVYGALWLLVCSVWAGLLRRQSFRILFTALAANAFLLALLGIAQQATGAKGLFWALPSPNVSFVASFIYRNHAGAWFNLMLAVAAGLAWWQLQRAERHLAKSSPAGLFAFFAVGIAVMVLFSFSRMSTLILVAFILVAGGIFAVREGRGNAGARNRTLLAGLALVMVVFIATGMFALNAGRVWKRLETVRDAPDDARVEANQAAAAMLADRWVLGWGAGCFRHGFPIYAMRHPSIHFSGANQRKFWEHAHNDLLQFPIEFGAVGAALIVGVLGAWGWQLARLRFWRNPLALLPILGCLFVLLHAGADFVFQCPAILLPWCVLLVAARRWVELDSPSVR